jgi:GNAT superfamily N-acetyltransferase
MEIRRAAPEDTAAIIRLLELSLGNASIPKTLALWKWKHESNPFGKSPVFVAIHGEKLIGVRAFMQWHWQDGKKTYNALRAVDTATHPEWHGRGVFRQLTSTLVSSSASKGLDFIFNTPNKRSLPGYMSMGWKIKGRLPLKFKLVRPWEITKNVIQEKAADPIRGITPTDWSEVAEHFQSVSSFPHAVGTNYTPEYLRWRYLDCPIFEYGYLTDHVSYLLIYRIKTHPFFHELRITELLPLEKKGAIDLAHLKLEIKKKVEDELPVHLISYSGENHRFFPITGLGWSPTLKMGPLVIIRDLNMGGKLNHLLSPYSTNFSLGDLELF